MNWLDTTLLIVLFLFFIRGMFRGLVREILSLLALMIGAFLASEYHGLLTPFLSNYFSGEPVIRAVSYILIFFGTIITFWIIAKIIHSLVDLSLLGWLDRALGAVFGLAEGVLIGLVALLMLQSFMPDAEFLKNSMLAHRAQPLVELLADFTPQTFRDQLKSTGIDIPSTKDVKDAVGLDSNG